MKTRRILTGLFLVLASAGTAFADAIALPEPEKPNYIIPIAVTAICVTAIALIIKKRKT